MGRYEGFISLEDSTEVREVTRWFEILLDFNRSLLCCSAVEPSASNTSFFTEEALWFAGGPPRSRKQL